MTIKIHGFPLSPRAFKVLFAAHHMEIPFELVPLDFAKGDNRTAAFTALNPNQKMPVLEHDGFVLWESNAIVQYLAELKPALGLLPKALQPRMDVVRWQFWETAHWDATCAIFMFERVVKPLFGMGGPDPKEIAKGEQQMARFAPVLDGALAKSRFVAGDALTIADLSLIGSFALHEAAGYPLGEFRQIGRWLAAMKALPAWGKAKAMAPESR